MPRLNYRRGRYLLVTAIAELGLGVSYAVETTRSREAAFSWMQFGLRIEHVGWLVIACGIAGVIAAFRSRRPRWDRIGWVAISIPPTMLALLWAWSGVVGLIDGDPATSGWTPWATVLVYAAMSAMVHIASDWPNPAIITADDLAPLRECQR